MINAEGPGPEIPKAVGDGDFTNTLVEILRAAWRADRKQMLAKRPSDLINFEWLDGDDVGLARVTLTMTLDTPPEPKSAQEVRSALAALDQRPLIQAYLASQLFLMMWGRNAPES